MLGEMIRTQWRRVRIPVIIVSLLLLSVPLLIVRSGPTDDVGRVGQWLHYSEQVGRVIPLLALGCGLLLGIAAWTDDARGGHVYALSLPLSRERYILYRCIAGGLPMLVPALTMLSGGLIAAAAVQLPPGVHAYPVALAVRTLLAILVCYAIFFAIAVASKHAARVFLLALVGLISLDLILSIIEVDFSSIEAVVELLVTWPGPLAILTGRWALFDV